MGDCGAKGSCTVTYFDATFTVVSRANEHTNIFYVRQWLPNHLHGAQLTPVQLRTLCRINSGATIRPNTSQNEMLRAN